MSTNRTHQKVLYSNYRETINTITVINKIHALRSMKLRSERNNTILLTPVLVFAILKYINPLLHYLVSESALIDVAKRGDVRLFHKIINDFARSLREVVSSDFNSREVFTPVWFLYFCCRKWSRFGHLNRIKWFFARFINKVNGSDIVNGIVLSSILGNHMHILEWISEALIWAPQTEWDRTTNFGNNTMFVARASRHGNLIMVKFLIDKGFEYTYEL